MIRPELHPMDDALLMGEVAHAVSDATNHKTVLVIDVG